MSNFRQRGTSVTLADVARRAGVSLSTASRVLNGLPRVSDETRTRVLSAVEALEYTVDPRGRALAIGRSQALGLLLCDFGARDDLTLARAVLDAAAGADLRVYVAESRGNADRRREAVARWRTDGVDAVILLPDPQAEGQEEEWRRELTAYVAQGGQVVHVGTKNRELPGAALVLEEFDAAADLGELLARSGYHRFAVMAPNNQDLRGDRAKGFEAGVRRVHGEGVSIALIVLGEFGLSADVRGWWSEEGQATDCVFAVNVDSANILASWLGEQGVGIPEEVSLATFGYASRPASANPITAALMPTDVAAVRALALAANEVPSALRVVGTCVLGNTTRGDDAIWRSQSPGSGTLAKQGVDGARELSPAPSLSR